MGPCDLIYVCRVCCIIRIGNILLLLLLLSLRGGGGISQKSVIKDDDDGMEKKVRDTRIIYNVQFKA